MVNSSLNRSVIRALFEAKQILVKLIDLIESVGIANSVSIHLKASIQAIRLVVGGSCSAKRYLRSVDISSLHSTLLGAVPMDAASSDLSLLCFVLTDIANNLCGVASMRNLRVIRLWMYDWSSSMPALLREPRFMAVREEADLQC